MSGAVSTALACEHCEQLGAKRVPCQTRYHWDGKGEDPNRDPVLCAGCAEDYLTYWQERWEEYYGGLL